MMEWTVLYRMLLFATFVCGSRSSCPRVCQCWDGFVTCSGLTGDVPSDTTSLTLNYTSMTSIPSSSFSHLHMLGQLRVTDNARLTAISKDAFSGLSLLSVLDLSRNAIQEIPHHMMYPISHVNVLNLDDNRLTELTVDNLYGANDLVRLSVRRNDLASLGKGNLSFISPLLQELVLANNRLDHLGEALHGLIQLRLLDVSGNKLVSIPDLRTTRSLEYLDISSNRITHIGNDLQGLPLKVLRIEHCEDLLYIADNALTSLMTLQSLFITHNPHLNKVSIPDTQSLETVDLSYNHLTSLSGNISLSKALQSLYLDGNPLRCDCSLNWTRPSVRGPHLAEWSTTLHNDLCMFPENLKDIPLGQLYREDLTCLPPDVRILNGSLVQVSIGDNVTIVANMSQGMRWGRWRLAADGEMLAADRDRATQTTQVAGVQLWETFDEYRNMLSILTIRQIQPHQLGRYVITVTDGISSAKADTVLTTHALTQTSPPMADRVKSLNHEEPKEDQVLSSGHPAKIQYFYIFLVMLVIAFDILIYAAYKDSMFT